MSPANDPCMASLCMSVYQGAGASTVGVCLACVRTRALYHRRPMNIMVLVSVPPIRNGAAGRHATFMI